MHKGLAPGRRSKVPPNRRAGRLAPSRSVGYLLSAPYRETAISVLERLKSGLEPAIRVDREIGAGGMGTVFAGYDTELDRPIAIKVLRPELATATAYERFLREARLLAKLQHPNVIPVHQAGSVDGLPYFIMDYVRGETLAARLESGPLDADRVRSIGRDLLRALEAVHQLGIVHRDVKPANIFLLEDRALLGDFGIARVIGGDGDKLTATGLSPGTPAYMAPEQRMGVEGTAAGDIWAAGATLFEAATGVRYDLTRPSSTGLGGLPRDLGRALERALSIDPAERWESAARFGRALEPASWIRRRAPALIAAGLVLGVFAVGWFHSHRSEPSQQPTVVVASPLGSATPMADSVRRWLVLGLAGFPDFRVADGGSPPQRALILEPAIDIASGRLRFGAVLRDDRRSNDLGRWDGDPRDWRRLADSLIDAVVIAVLTGRGGSDPWLPREALPQSVEGLRGLLRGERLYAAAQWEDAAAAYLALERLDSTCSLCSYRLDDTDRWLSRPHDPARTARLQARIDRFPPAYQALIRATTTPLPARLDSLRKATETYWGFYLAWYRYGEELFHRGPLYGRRRREAIESFRTAVRLRPEFMPVWSHLTWIAVAEGDSLLAADALARVRRNERPEAPIDRDQRALVEAGFAWRFTDHGAVVTAGFLADSGVASSSPLAAAPRLFPMFDTPQAAVWLGDQFARRTTEPQFTRSGLIALALGRIGLGQIDSALAAASVLRATATDSRTRTFAVGLGPALALAEGDSLSASAADSIVAPLVPLLEPAAHSARDRHEAGLLVGLAGVTAGSTRWSAAGLAALADEPTPRPFRQLLEAARLARAARFDSAAALAEAAARDPTASDRSPFFRALTSLARARWLVRAGRPAAAEIVLAWHENSDLPFPTAEPLASEFDWAVSTTARWETARLLDVPARATEACADYAAVHRRWTNGDRRFALRADSAKSALKRLGCRVGTPIR